MILLFVFFTLIFYILYNNYYSKINKKYKWLPGPKNYPLIGSSFQFVQKGAKLTISNLIQAYCNKYGNFCGLEAGAHYFIFVEDPKVGKDMLEKDQFIGKFPPKGVSNYLYPGMGLGLINSYGKISRETRKFSMKYLKKYGFGRTNVMDICLQEEMNDFMEDLDKKMKENNGIVKVQDMFHLHTLNIIWYIMSGVKFTNSNEELKKIIYLTGRVLKYNTIGFSLLFAFPLMRFSPAFTPWPLAKKLVKKLIIYFEEILKERRSEGSYKEDPRDFVDTFIKYIEDKVDPNLYTDEHFIATCIDLFLAGMDTTATSLEWTLLFLIKNPRVYKNVLKEINSVIGNTRAPSLEDRLKMPYTEATMLEAQRWGNVAPFAMRAPIKDTEYDGYHLPGNSLIIIHLRKIHFSKEVWGDPETFRPERFLDENNNIINAEKLMGFGAGKRHCIGELPSKMTAFIFFTTLLQKYHFEKSPIHEDPTLEPIDGLLSPPHPYHVKFTIRN